MTTELKDIALHDKQMFVEIIAEDTSAGGISYHSWSRKPYSKGKVLLIGKKITELQINDIILFKTDTGIETVINKKKILIFRGLEDIYGKIELDN